MTPAADQSRSHLLSLPPELRCIVYDSVFDGSIIDMDRHKPTPKSIGLLFSNKQIHSEATEVYYGRTSFTTYDEDWEWLRAIPADYVDRISTIQVLYRSPLRSRTADADLHLMNNWAAWA